MQMLYAIANVNHNVNDLTLRHFAIILLKQIQEGASGTQLTQNIDGLSILRLNLLSIHELNNVWVPSDLLPNLDLVLYQVHCIFCLDDHFLHGVFLPRLLSDLVHEAVSTFGQLFLDQYCSTIYLQVLRSRRWLSLL